MNFRAYFDESYDTGAFAVGGFAAWESEWQKLEKRWQRVIRDNRISRYHAADCNNGYGEFFGWPRERRNGIAKRLIHVLTKHRVYGFFVGVGQQDFKAVTGDFGNDAPYMLCFQHCVQTIMKSVSTVPKGVKVDFIADAVRFGGRVTECFRWMKFERDWEGRERMGNLTLASWQDHIPLQCADLMAYEAFKKIRHSLFEPHRSPRKSFAVLWDKVPLVGGYYEREGLLALKKAIEAKSKLDS